jgi:hypothetical protein
MANKFSSEELLTNLRAVAGASRVISRSRYRNSARRKFASSTIEERFGSFTKAVKRAGLRQLGVN